MIEVVSEVALATARQQGLQSSTSSLTMTRDDGSAGYFSQDLRACFWVSSFWCLAARFSFSDLLGFFGWLDGVDLFPMHLRYGVSAPERRLLDGPSPGRAPEVRADRRDSGLVGAKVRR